MNEHDEFKMGERLGQIEGNIKVNSSKLDNLTEKVQNLTQGIGSTVQRLDRSSAEHGINLENNDKHISWVSKKADKYFWGLITIIMSLVGLAYKVIAK